MMKNTFGRRYPLPGRGSPGPPPGARPVSNGGAERQDPDAELHIQKGLFQKKKNHSNAGEKLTTKELDNALGDNKTLQKTWEETWKQREKQHGVNNGNDGENDGQDLTKNERKPGD